MTESLVSDTRGMTESLVSGRERERAYFDKLFHKMPVHPVLVQSVFSVLISRILCAAQDRAV